MRPTDGGREGKIKLNGDVQNLHQVEALPKRLQLCMAQAGQMLKGLKYWTTLPPQYLGSPEIFKKVKWGRGTGVDKKK